MPADTFTKSLPPARRLVHRRSEDLPTKTAPQSTLRTSKSEANLNPRLTQIESGFLDEEAHAKQDLYFLWSKIGGAKGTDFGLNEFSSDVVIRTIRSSLYLIHPERRLERNVKILKNRLKITAALKVNKSSKDPTRLELYRNLVVPLKVYGTSNAPEKTPLLKLSVKEMNLPKALQEISDPVEMKHLTFQLLENILKKVKELGCRGESGSEDVYVAGKFILVVDLEGYSWSHLQYGLRMNFGKIVDSIAKSYPEILKKVYFLLGSGKSRDPAKKTLFMLKLSSYLNVNHRTFLKKLTVFDSEHELLNKLVSEDNFCLTQLPNEVGGCFEGRYVLE